MSFVFLEINYPLEVFREPGKPDITGKIEPVMQIESDGILKIVPRDKEKQSFRMISVICLKEWKCDKERGFIPIERVFVTGEEKEEDIGNKPPFFLIPKDKLEKAKPTLNWLNEKSEFPDSGLDEFVMNLWIAKNKTNPVAILQMQAILLAIKEQKLDSHFESLATKNKLLSDLYKMLVVEKLELKYKPNQISESIYKKLNKIAIEVRESTVKNFFAQDKSWSDLAKEYNEMLDMPYVPEMIFRKNLETGLFKVSGSITYSSIGVSKDNTSKSAKWKIEIKIGEGVFLIEETEGKVSEPIFIEKIMAESTSYPVEGLKFKMTTEISDFELTPVETPTAFNTGQKLKKMLADLPKNYQEIFEQYNNRKALQLTAMKFGSGGLNRSSGMYEYALDNIDIIFYAFKKGVNAAPDDIKGSGLSYNLTKELEGYLIGFDWYQRYDKATKTKSLHINYKTNECGRECFERAYQKDCFSKQSVLGISFLPKELDENYPELDFGEETKRDPCFIPFY
jgi:hypothetical protein